MLAVEYRRPGSDRRCGIEGEGKPDDQTGGGGRAAAGPGDQPARPGADRSGPVQRAGFRRHHGGADQRARGVSRRTFFRYFDSKAAVLWSEFDHEVETLHRLLREAPAEQPMTEAIRQAVLQANHYGVDDVAELRARMHVISTVPALGASATVHYDGWAGALAEFAARRLGQQPDDLIPQAIGFSALGCLPGGLRPVGEATATPT